MNKNVLLKDIESIKNGITLNDKIKSLTDNNIENFTVKKLENKFGKDRDMKLLEYNDVIFDGIKINVKYYIDKEFDTFYYGIEPDMKIRQEVLINKIKNNKELSQEEIELKYHQLVNSESFKREQEQIKKAEENRKIIKFDEYRVTLGLYFFNKEHREKLKEILVSYYGESEKYDGHDIWNKEGNRIELAPAMFTYTIKI